MQTRVLTARIVELIHNHKAQPWQIMAITFTNKVCVWGGAADHRHAAEHRGRVACSSVNSWPPCGGLQAATEMRERLSDMLGGEAGKQLFAGTFHRQVVKFAPVG